MFFLYLYASWSLPLSLCLPSKCQASSPGIKRKEWSQKISSFHKISGVTASWWGVRTLLARLCGLFAPGSLHITVVMVTEEPRHQRPRRRYHSPCYALNLSLPNFWRRPHAFFKGVLSSRRNEITKPSSLTNVKIWWREALPVCSACLPPQAEAISALLILLTGLWLELPLFPTCSLATWDCESSTVSSLWVDTGEAENNKGCNLKATPAFLSHQLGIVFFLF